MKNKRSESTRALIRDKALIQGEHRSNNFKEHVLSVMEVMQKEISENGGIYPRNKGRISLSELARRADVCVTSFYTENQCNFREGDVADWISKLKGKETGGEVQNRRSLDTRIADWKELYNNLAQSHRDTELELQQTRAELEKLRNEIAGTNIKSNSDESGKIIDLATRR